MRTPASIAHHPLHPMLIALPIGSWVLSIACDLMYRFGSHVPFWSLMAGYLVGAGLITALVAAIPGFIDWWSIEDPVAKRLGILHMASNLTAVALFAVSFWLRLSRDPRSTAAFVLSLVGFAVLSVGGWLGGSLVYKHRIAVDESGASRASSSFRSASSGRPVTHV